MEEGIIQSDRLKAALAEQDMLRRSITLLEDATRMEKQLADRNTELLSELDVAQKQALRFQIMTQVMWREIEHICEENSIPPEEMRERLENRLEARVDELDCRHLFTA